MSMKKLLESIDRISEAYLPPDHPWWNLPPAERLKKQREAEMERDRLDAEVWHKGLKQAEPKKTDESAPDTKFVGDVHRRVEECGDDFVCIGAKVYVQGNEGGEPLTVTRIIDDHQVVVADDYGQRHTVMIRDLAPADNDSLTEELKAAFEDYVSNEKYDADHLYPAKSKKPSVDKPKQKTPKVIDPKVVSESADTTKEMVTFGESEFDTWQQYAQEEGYEVREAGNLPGSYASFDERGRKTGYFMNEFDLPNGELVAGKMLITPSLEEQGVSEGFNGISVNIEPELDYDVVYVDINGKKYNFNYWYTDEKPTDELGFRKDTPHYLKREEWYNKLDFPTKMEVLHAVVQAELGNEPSEYQPTVGDEPLDEQGVNEGTNHRKESALRAKLPTNEGFTVTPGINRERYTDLSAEGLEGPFQMKNGKVLYYDKKAGQYYDRDTDMYVDYDDYQAMNEDMEDGDWGNTPFEAYGVKGMKNTPWRKVFKNGKQAAAWCEKFDAEIHGSRELDSDELARMQRPKASKDWKMNEDENLTELSRDVLNRYMSAVDDELGTPKFEKKQRDQKKYQLAFNKAHLPDPKKVKVPATEGKAAKIKAMRKKIGELQEAVKAAKAKMGGKTLEETPIDQNVKPVPGQAQTPSQQAPAPAGTPTVAAQPGQPQAPAAGQPGGAPVAAPPGTPQPATGGAASAASTPAEQMKGLVQSLANDPAAAKQLGIKLGTVR